MIDRLQYVQVDLVLPPEVHAGLVCNEQGIFAMITAVKRETLNIIGL
jgi:hypothetical protein